MKAVTKQNGQHAVPQRYPVSFRINQDVIDALDGLACRWGWTKVGTLARVVKFAAKHPDFGALWFEDHLEEKGL